MKPESPEKKPKTRCAIYTRVSTVNHQQDPDLQLRDLQPFAAKNGWRVIEYQDRMSSGKVRPNLERLKADARQHKFDIVLVWKFDRFARSVRELHEALEAFDQLDIKFVSFTEQIDTRTPAGKLVFSVLGAVAEMEKALVHERVVAGLKNARAKGKQLGRPQGIAITVDRLGLTKNKKRLGRPKGKVKVYDPALVAQVNAMRSRTRENPDGLSYREIAKRLTTPERPLHPNTVYNIVNRPA